MAQPKKSRGEMRKDSEPLASRRVCANVMRIFRRRRVDPAPIHVIRTASAQGAPFFLQFVRVLNPTLREMSKRHEARYGDDPQALYNFPNFL
jgi:hypothetical protein